MKKWQGVLISAVAMFVMMFYITRLIAIPPLHYKFCFQVSIVVALLQLVLGYISTRKM